MKTVHKLMLSALFAVSLPVLAMDLQQAMSALGSAKSQGLVGEQPNGYLGGHYVLGHVDTTAKVKMVQPGEKAWFFTIAIPSQFVKYVVYKGSVAINGISLTINKVIDDDIELCIIPVTIEKTNMSLLNVNDSVNIEFDILAKYTEQLLNKRAVKDV